MGERKGTLEGAVPPLSNVEPPFLTLLSRLLLLSTNREDVVLELDLDLFLPDAGELRCED